MTTICQRHGCVVNFVETSEPRIGILRMDFSEIPVGDEMDAVILIISAFIKHHEGRLVIHARHVNSSKLIPPNMQGMLSIVGKILELKDIVNTKLKGTIVQGTCIDDLVIMAKNMFLTIYQPKTPFDVVVTDEDVTKFMAKILEHELKKRARREIK